LKGGDIMAKIVSYDLCAPGRDYTSLISEIKKYPTWCKVTESCWCISSNDDCTTIVNNLKQHIDANDKLIVFALTGAASWVKISCTSEALKEILKQ
jgi:cobalamin biosynthesis Co2+ chelatase CbiK